MKWIASTIIFAACTLAAAQVNSCPACNGLIALTHTGTANANLKTETFAIEVYLPLSTSWTWVPNTQPSSGFVILNCDTSNKCYQQTVPYPTDACSPAIGMNWNGQKFVCVTVAQMKSALGIK